jgi:formate hydrogenlyase transcriptional activator
MFSSQQILQLQLEVSATLTQHTTRDGIGLALAEVLNKVVPFEFFLHSIWMPENPVINYRISSIKGLDGKFISFDDRELDKVARENRELMMQSGWYLTQPGTARIYYSEDLRKLSERFPSFGVGYNVHKIRTVMIFYMPHENGFQHVIIISHREENAFSQDDYDLISALLPQIRLGFDNLFKYEELRRQEDERKIQLTIMTAFTGFDGKRELDDMALETIGKLNEFLNFNFWFTITSEAPVKNYFFRIAYRDEDGFRMINGPESYTKINHPEILPTDFKRDNPSLYSTPKLFVGEAMDELVKSSSFFRSLHEHLNVNSLINVPVTILGKQDTMYLMASVRQYAFTEADVQLIARMLPYISMGGQQFYFLLHTQALTNRLKMEKHYLEEEIRATYNFEEIIGTSHLMKEVFRKISQVSGTDSTVLILGETGTGKELIARAIHDQSSRNEKVLVKVNCAALPAQLIESELFGHEKGSFTGAFEKRIGKFELANGGTIFLDEIGELPMELQAKLLRVLQEREIERLGGKTTIPVDVRIIAATNRNLETEVTEGRFRSDLYYRLNVFPIHLPPLRQRREDIPMLVTHFHQKFSRKMKRSMHAMKDTVLQDLMQYDWPGNIRELENIIEQMVIVGDSNAVKLQKSATKHISENIVKKTSSGAFSEDEVIRVLKQTKGKIAGPEGAASLLNMRPAKIEEYERKWILHALQKTGGRIRGENGAASMIGLKPTTLEARIKKLRIAKAEIFGK